MASFKVVISDPKTRKSYQKEIEQPASGLLGKKIRDMVPGNVFGLAGYELEVTGGSDKEGFPMRHDVHGTARKKVLLSSGPGFHPQRKGQRKKKSVHGNTVSERIVQVNAKVVKHGPKTIEELWGIKPKEPEKKEEKPAPEKEAKPERAAEHKEHPKEEHKHAEKPEEKAGVEKKAEEKTAAGKEKNGDKGSAHKEEGDSGEKAEETLEK